MYTTPIEPGRDAVDAGTHNEKLYTVNEVCELLCIKDTETIYRLIRSKKIGHYIVGAKKAYRISQSQIDDYLRRARVEPVPPAPSAA